jgi:hypothetical protein
MAPMGYGGNAALPYNDIVRATIVVPLETASSGGNPEG